MSIYVDVILDRLKESHEINQKANDILSEVTRTVNELKILKKSVLSSPIPSRVDRVVP